MLDANARRQWLFWGAVAACVLPGLVDSIRADLFFRRADTRTLRPEASNARIPAGSSVLVQPYSAPLTSSREALVEALTQHVGSTAAASTKLQLQLSLDPYPAPAYRVIYLGRGGLDVDRLYVDPSDLGGEKEAPGSYPPPAAWHSSSSSDTMSRIRSFVPFVAALAREARRIAVFSPYRPGVTRPSGHA